MIADPTREDLAALGARFLPDVDVDELTDRFRIWQAVTHGFEIDNPMSSETLDAVLDLLEPRPGERAIDIPCGRGELLCRLAERNVEGTGVDISPWVIRDAAHRAAERGVELDLVLGDGKDHPREPSWDLATSLGGSWIWNGTYGTLRALRALLRPGGRAALGDLILREGVEPTSLEGVGVPLTRSGLREQVAEAGFGLREWVAPGDDAWRTYNDRYAAHASTWDRDEDERAAAARFAAEADAEFEAEVASFEWVVVVLEG